MNKYAGALAELNYQKPALINVDFDTGKKTIYGEYELTDKAYIDLMDKLQENKYAGLTVPLKRNIMDFYN